MNTLNAEKKDMKVKAKKTKARRLYHRKSVW